LLNWTVEIDKVHTSSIPLLYYLFIIYSKIECLLPNSIPQRESDGKGNTFFIPDKILATFFWKTFFPDAGRLIALSMQERLPAAFF